MVKVPSIVQNYNMHIGGVDLNNMLFGLYRASHKSRNWTKVTFFCVIAHGSDKRMAALSKKTKCRVVFDGSAEWNGTSLNSCLDTGPKLQSDLVAVGLPPEDQDVCRFIWQERGCEATVKRQAYCYLFLANVRTCEQKIRARLSLLELQSAEKRGMRAIQAEAFPVLKIVSGPIPFLQTEDPLAALSPIVDTEGFLRPIVLRAHESELHAELNEPKLGSFAASLLDGSGPASSQEMHQSSHHLPKGTSFSRKQIYLCEICFMGSQLRKPGRTGNAADRVEVQYRLSSLVRWLLGAACQIDEERFEEGLRESIAPEKAGNCTQRCVTGKGRPSVLGGRRRSAEPLETGRDYRAVDGKRRVHKVSEGTDRPGPSHPVEQIADSSRASLGLVMNCGPSRGWEKTAKNHFCSSLTIRIRYRNQWLAVVVT
ncbi:hypothetical protein T4E_11527 [Trichinella pseudospiralis]|uniref:Uncharacterized protein n=1 Tax=Trichinella pseudospiralis TaxID=6337 RepID=A0A0V0YJV4_TRIPS|nr:hypothetical protein T4E_11527 [Trichinella pseudospiralis]